MRYRNICFLIFSLLTSLVMQAQNTVCFDIEVNPNPTDPALSFFTKYVDVFGIGIYAEESVADVKVLHLLDLGCLVQLLKQFGF